MHLDEIHYIELYLGYYLEYGTETVVDDQGWKLDAAFLALLNLMIFDAIDHGIFRSHCLS